MNMKLHLLRVLRFCFVIILIFVFSFYTSLWKRYHTVVDDVRRQAGSLRWFPVKAADRNLLRQQEVRKQCSRFPHLANRTIDHSQLGHLVVDDEHKIIWCNIPKVACTNWKRAFLILRGVNKSKVLSMSRGSVHGQGLKTLAQFYGDHEAIKYRLENYLKFVVVRDHWDRLLSCFRDKYENNSAGDPGFRNSAGIASIRHYSHANQPNFKGFLDFIINDPKSLKRPPKYPENEHWVQFYKLCNPCAITFDVIGKYDTFAEDSNYILSRANITHIVGRFPEKLTAHEEKNRKRRGDNKLSKYYKQIESSIIERIAHLYQEDIEIFNLKRTP